METVKQQRKQTTFRLRTDVMDVIRRNAALENRTLNSYVESLLLEDAYPDIPNLKTRAAIAEAENGGTGETFENVEDLMSMLMRL